MTTVQDDAPSPPEDGEPDKIIDVDHVGPVPLSTARKIYRSIASHFGGQQSLGKDERVDRARKAANTRWGNKS